MSAVEHYPYFDGAILSPELFEIHRSKISIHHAKAGYSYPTIRLPHMFSALTGLSTQIFQTVHKGALAFLVVVSPTSKSNDTAGGFENDTVCSETSAFTRRPRHGEWGAYVLCASL